MPDITVRPEGGWRRFALSAYGPTGLSSIGHGATAPLIALSALDMGASVELSALITGLAALGQLAGDLPASWVATRLGEKRAIVAACLWDAACLGLAFVATSLPLLCLAVFCFGPAGSVFGLARQSYITEAVPLLFRARALSTLGGVFRIGGFLGPLAGSAVIAAWDLNWAYAFAAGTSLLAAGVTLALPDLPSDVRSRRQQTRPPKLWPVLRQHLRVFVTLGTGTLILTLVRSVRQAILPLWCDSLGLTASATSLVFAVSMGIDMSLFFLGGSIMDRFGRFWVATPSLIVLGLGLAALPLTHHVVGVVVAAGILGLGNGIGSGLIMVLGSDASPTLGRTQFLSGWRLMSDVGNTLGPLAISAIVAVASLAVSGFVLGGVAWLGSAWLGYWVRRFGPPKPADQS
ncbi:MAG: MFS transporter [Propionibacteriaceae bacterium]|nr:MFS transporter [Propionibacteriaceae bacterium]